MRLLLIPLILLMGCATTAKYEEHLRSWKGKKGSELVTSEGVPERSGTLANGSNVYEYRRYGSGDYLCRTTFITDASDTISQISYEGVCPAR